MDEDDKLLTIKDICEALSISRRTLERIRGKEFMTPTLWVGKSPRWSEKKLKEWLTKQRKL